LLPTPNAEVGHMLDEVFKQLTDNVPFVRSYFIDSDKNTINTNFVVERLEDYTDLTEEIKTNGFFAIEVPMNSNRNSQDDTWEVSHTFNVVGYQGNEPEEEDGQEGFHTDISNGTNFDEMLESVQGGN